MADQRTTATKRSTAAKKAAATRSRNEAARTGYAERAVLVPLGAVLTARDVAVATAARFEDRGRTERTRVAARADLLTARVENLVQTGITRGTQVATTVQKRLANVG